MGYDLTDEYLAEARQRAYRYQGQWTGTAGALAADVARLLIERKRMEGTITDLEETNSQLREAVENRMAGRGSMPTPDQLFGGGCCDGGKFQPTDDAGERWNVKAQASARAHAERLSGDSLLDDQGDISPAEKLLLDAIDVVRDRRPKYGGPRHHFRRTIGMINAAFSDVLKRPLTESDWAIFMTFDKVARFLGPNKTADGPIDLAGYAACLAECEAAEPD
jgi:hypothetical protein